MKPLKGKTVLITGGTAGIGKACAEAMLAAGAEAVVINGRSRERGERALAAIAAASLTLVSGSRSATWRKWQTPNLSSPPRSDNSDASTYWSTRPGTNDFPALLHKIPIEEVPGILRALSLRPAVELPRRAAAHACGEAWLHHQYRFGCRQDSDPRRERHRRRHGRHRDVHARARDRRQAQWHSCQCAHTFPRERHRIL